MNRSGLRPWKKGQSGNPAGRPKMLKLVQEEARQYTADCLATLVRIMQKGRSERMRLAAACALLDRAWGKPALALLNSGEEPTPSVIEVRFIEPKNSGTNPPSNTDKQ